MENEDLSPAPEQTAPEPAEREAPSRSEAIDNAFDKVFDDVPEMQSKRSRDDKGKFAPKAEAPKVEKEKPEDDKPEEAEKPKAEAKPKTETAKPVNPDEPPARLSAEAKAAWVAAPPALKADIHRTISEMEQGIAKYRETASRWDAEIKPYEQLAQAYGMDIKGVLADYEGMARMMATNPVQVFDTLAKRHGFTLQDVAAKVLGQDLDEYAKQTSQEIARLQQENMELRRQTQTFTQRQQQEVQSFIADFAVRNPRYSELEPQIAGILRSGLVTATEPRMRLQEAYEIADRLKPAPRTAPAPQTPAIADQTRKGQLSITGAPGSGSNPANRKTPASAREALDRAFDQFGL